jgi:hypothetical protein
MDIEPDSPEIVDVTREQELLDQVLESLDYCEAFSLNGKVPAAIVETLSPQDAAAVLDYWRSTLLVMMINAVDGAVRYYKARAASSIGSTQ